MKYLQLFRGTIEILGMSGIMSVEHTLTTNEIKKEVVERNKTFVANFPNKVADSYAIYSNRIGSKLSPLVKV